MDLLFSAVSDWPGIRDPSVKDVIAKYQIQVEAWYVANPDLTVAETRRLERVGQALDEFLDKVSQ
jgi:ABC-type hemin transport system substrate-binding protein